MANGREEDEDKRRAFIASLEEARKSLRLHGSASIEQVRCLFDELDRQLEDDERAKASVGRVFPAR